MLEAPKKQNPHPLFCVCYLAHGLLAFRASMSVYGSLCTEVEHPIQRPVRAHPILRVQAKLPMSGNACISDPPEYENPTCALNHIPKKTRSYRCRPVTATQCAALVSDRQARHEVSRQTCRVQGPGFRVESLGFREFRVQGVQGSRF